MDEIKSTVGDMLLELSFLDIKSGVWVLSDMVQVELRKSVRNRSIFIGDSFSFSDVKEVIDGVSDYLSEWGFVPYWSEDPGIEVRVNWGGENTDICGYDSCLYLRWKSGGRV